MCYAHCFRDQPADWVSTRFPVQALKALQVTGFVRIPVFGSNATQPPTPGDTAYEANSFLNVCARSLRDFGVRSAH